VRGGPDVLEVDILALLVLPERIADDVDVHRAASAYATHRGGEAR